MLFHQGEGARLVFQEHHMPQLIDLVIADGLHTEKLLHILQVGFTGCHDGYSTAREGNLGG